MNTRQGGSREGRKNGGILQPLEVARSECANNFLAGSSYCGSRSYGIGVRQLEGERWE